jgi:hypothetical protein
VTYSLNEIEMTSFKAARGAGVPWGLAEEAGKAARWLAAHKLPALDALAGMLDLIDRRSYGDLTPVREGERWVGRGGLLCAVNTGVTLCDRAEDLAAGERFETGPIAYPLLVVPFVAAAQRAAGAAFAVEWPGVSIGVDEAGLHMMPDTDMLAVAADELICELRPEALSGGVVAAEVAGLAVDPALWARLTAYAHRTYVPASDASRERGAGAGLDDND